MPVTYVTDSAPALFGLLLFIECMAALYVATKSDQPARLAIKAFLQWSFVIAAIGFIGTVVFGFGGSPTSSALMSLTGLNLVFALAYVMIDNHRHPEDIVRSENDLR